MRCLRRKWALAVTGLLIFLLFGAGVQAEELCRVPMLHGAVKTWMYQGDTWDESANLNRVFADDLEDGDLTGKIREIYNDVNTEETGTYKVTYEVVDSDGNKAQMNTSVQVLSREDTGEKLVQRKLYTLGDGSHLTGISFNRGYYHDRQNLGIWLPEEAKLTIRLVNGEEFGQNLTVEFMNQDAETESRATIPQTGEFVELQNSFVQSGSDEAAGRDSVPFIVTPKNTSIQPIVEWKWTEELREIPYYRYGDKEQGFFESWRENDDPYAIIEGNSATFLVPVKDRDEILNASFTENPAYRFQRIDEMLEWYDAFVKQYDAYAGLDFYAEEPYNQNLRSRFFIKANEHGIGQAYYTTDHSAYNGDSLNAYLTRSWLSLHEFGHGYEGDIAFREHPFVETTNNIMGYYFEPTYRTADDFGWLLGGFWGTKEQRWAALEQRALQRRKETSSFAGIVAGAYHYDVSLYMFVNVLDKLGPQQAVSAMHSQYRKNYYETKKASSASDVIVDSFSRAGGYNVIPYFETWHIAPSLRMADAVYEKDYPIVYYLAELIPDRQEAESVRKELGLCGTYSLVSTDELAYTGYESEVEFSISIDDFAQVENKEILIKNGEKTVKALRITGPVMKVTLPVGAYELELPTARSQEYICENDYLIAAKSGVKKQIVYERETGNPLTDDLQLWMAGLSDGVFARASFDTSKGTMRWKTEQVVPHSYFEETYASVRIFDENGKELFYQSFQGDEQAEEMEKEFPFGVGARLEIYHREAGSRLKFMSTADGEPYKAYGTPGETTVYVMTKRGLMRQDWDETKQHEVYMSALDKHAERLMASANAAELKNPECFSREKLLLRSAYKLLGKEEKEEFRSKWGSLFGMKQDAFIEYEKIPSSMLTAFADSECGIDTDGVAADAVDGDETTYWHSNYTDGVQPDIPNGKNNSITLLLESSRDIGKLEYVPRPGGGNGTILAYELYYSPTEDQEDFQKIPLENNTWAEDGSTKTTVFAPVHARRIRLCALSTAGFRPDTFISAAEFYLYEGKRMQPDTDNSPLSGLCQSYKSGDGTVPGQDKNAAGGAITLYVNGEHRVFEKGIGLKTGMDITYDLSGKAFEAFSAYLGVEAFEEEGKKASVLLYGDGELLYQSGMLSGRTEAEMVYLDVRNVRRLQICVNGSGGTALSLGAAGFYREKPAEELTLKVGEKINAGENTALFKKALSWQSGNPAAAKVDAAGNVTAVGAGETLVTAADVNGNSFQCRVRVTEPQAPIVKKPGKTTGLTISAKKEKALTISWRKTEGAWGYEIWRAKKGSKSFGKAGDVKGTSFTDTGLAAGTSYIYKVRAYVRTSGLQYGAFSSELWSTTKPAKMKLQKVKQFKKQVLLSWKKNKQAEGVEIWVKQSKGKYKLVKALSGKKTSVKIKKLKRGKKYTFKIRAYRKDAAKKKVYGAYSNTKALKLR